MSGSPLATGRTAEVFDLEGGRVLKLFDEGTDAAAARREATNAAAARAAGVRTPAVRGLTAEFGRHGVVFDRIDGPTLEERLLARPWGLRGAARTLADLQSTVHACEASALEPTTERLRERIETADALDSETKERVLDALANLPGGTAVCHGDFHPGNVVVSDDGPVVIDWMDATAGHPAADVARTALVLSVAPNPGTGVRANLFEVLRSSFRRRYLSRYRATNPVSASELDAWTLPVAAARLAEGVPGETERLRALVDELLGCAE